MKRNENIYIALEIQKSAEAKGLALSVQFDRNAPNFLEENGLINWCPTCDELDFITEAFALMGGNHLRFPEKEKETEGEEEVELVQEDDHSSQLEQTNYSHRSSEIRIAPLPNNLTIEETDDRRPLNRKDREDEEKVFIQADEKKIDEILQRKKQMAREHYAHDAEDKTIVERMMKQKKKKTR
ncbi:MAG: hypothetical protein JXA75_01880 [Candidatus Thermoplasmatota archaeon]|nr:hypothetical protein [Candidatus Thermoplasmatota archaeon]